MKRWQLTLMLGGLALVGALFATRLVGGARSVPSAPRAVDPIVEIGPASDSRAVVVVLDASQSMWAGSRMIHARHAIGELRDQLDPEQPFAVVAFNEDAFTAVPPDAGRHELDLLLATVRPAGGTNLYAGLELAAEHLERMRRPGDAGTLVVISDGRANVDVFEPRAFLAVAHELRDRGVTISTIGLGPDADAETLRSLAEATGGRTRMVDHARDLVRLVRPPRAPRRSPGAHK